MQKRKPRVIVLTTIMAISIFVAGCSRSYGTGKTTEATTQIPETTTEEKQSSGALDFVLDDLKPTMPTRPAEYTRDKYFLSGEVFEEDKEKGKIYAYIGLGEYVVVKNKAYCISASYEYVILDVKYTGNTPSLVKITKAPDGDDQDVWIKENFPAGCIEKARAGKGEGDTGSEFIKKELDAKAEAEFGIPVEKENILEIDE